MEVLRVFGSSGLRQSCKRACVINNTTTLPTWQSYSTCSTTLGNLKQLIQHQLWQRSSSTVSSSQELLRNVDQLQWSSHAVVGGGQARLYSKTKPPQVGATLTANPTAELTTQQHQHYHQDKDQNDHQQPAAAVRVASVAEAEHMLEHMMDETSRQHLMKALQNRQHPPFAGIVSSDDEASNEVSDANTRENVPQPTTTQLYHLFLRGSIPMVGFGFVDNFIMITAGDAIDATLGGYLHISTLAAAGLGNLVSDVSGLGLSSTIENMSGKLGLPPARLSPEQFSLPAVRNVLVAASMFGISVGCLLGMAPLLFMDHTPTCL